MSKTYAVKMAEAIKARLNEGHPFTIEADPPHWEGYIFVKHLDGAAAVLRPYATDKRKPPTHKAVEQEIRSIRYKLAPQPHFTPEWQDKHRTAHNDWLTATAVNEEGEEN